MNMGCYTVLRAYLDCYLAFKKDRNQGSELNREDQTFFNHEKFQMEKGKVLNLMQIVKGHVQKF